MKMHLKIYSFGEYAYIWQANLNSTQGEQKFSYTFHSIIICRYRKNQRGENVSFTQAEQESCMVNSAPGSPDLSILSFKGAFHGRTIGALATTHSKYIHKIDIPSFDWPIASFPQYKYPLEENERENKAEDARCLAEVEELIEKYNKKQKYVAGLIVEPIQSEGGDNEGSPEFFQGLQRITKKHGVALLIDEVQTGGGPTGKLWAHEHFNLDTPPDLVTFSKKMQLGGYYHTDSLKPPQAYRVFNTWMGDPGKLVLLEGILKVIKRDALLENVNRVGAKLKSGLIQAQNDYPALLNSARGRGTFLAINCASAQLRDDIINRLKAKGTPFHNFFINIDPIRCDYNSIYLILLINSPRCSVRWLWRQVNPVSASINFRRETC